MIGATSRLMLHQCWYCDTEKELKYWMIRLWKRYRCLQNMVYRAVRGLVKMVVNMVGIGCGQGLHWNSKAVIGRAGGSIGENEHSARPPHL